MGARGRVEFEAGLGVGRCAVTGADGDGVGDGGNGVVTALLWNDRPSGDSILFSHPA